MKRRHSVAIAEPRAKPKVKVWFWFSRDGDSEVLVKIPAKHRIKELEKYLMAEYFDSWRRLEWIQYKIPESDEEALEMILDRFEVERAE